MYGGGKGIADSALPYKRTPPSWLKISAGDVEDHGAFHLLLCAVTYTPPLQQRAWRLQ